MAEQFIIKIDGQKVEIRKSNGAIKKIINVCEDLTGAVLSGDEVHVGTKKGAVKVYSLNGSLKRTI